MEWGPAKPSLTAILIALPAYDQSDPRPTEYHQSDPS